ncbi:sigma-70 family RNA polymerase sigma factor [Streptomyces sp. GESEQ-35]|uniref:sigma-70 family RNA polymerase sigma factor n=1 Tax=Streptomyces sp. GESEQ-35 TaxID=2812657 RepID=UPI001B33399A|nr:sigma-70 family RNA polymerase sigma factor [Streptomyces sp. GESEQ-35]
MTDGLAAAPAPEFASATAAYARIYEEHQPRLVAYARTLTRNAWVAEDLVAEAHFRVWRRLAAGHEIDNVPAYLMTTVRHLAAAAGSGARETPRDPQTDEHAGPDAHVDDPAEQVSSVDLLVRVLGQLPERWVKALWLAEAEGQPLTAVGTQIGIRQGATAVLLHRAREGMRQAFLRTQDGAPDDPACEVHWGRMPAYVRGNATARQSERLLGHVDACDDCRHRLAVLMRANDRLPALTGPALLVFALGGAGKFLLPFAAGSAGAATAATAASAAGGHGSGLLHGVHQAVTGASKVPTSVAVGTTVVSAAAALVLALGVLDSPSGPPEGVPVAKGPVTEIPVEQPPKDVAAEVPVDRQRSEQAGSDERTGPAHTVVDAPADAAVVVPVTAIDGSAPNGSEPVPATPEAPEEGAEEPGSPAPEPSEPAPVEETPAPPEPAEPTQPTEPTEPSGPYEPTDPTEPTDPAEPTEPVPADPEPAPSTPPAPGGDCGD